MNTRYYHQQQLIHQHVSLLQNNYTLNVMLKIKAEEEVSSSLPMKYILLYVSHAFGVLHIFLLRYTKELQKKPLQSAPPVLKEI